MEILTRNLGLFWQADYRNPHPTPRVVLTSWLCKSSPETLGCSDKLTTEILTRDIGLFRQADNGNPHPTPTVVWQADYRNLHMRPWVVLTSWLQKSSPETLVCSDKLTTEILTRNLGLFWQAEYRNPQKGPRVVLTSWLQKSLPET